MVGGAGRALRPGSRAAGGGAALGVREAPGLSPTEALAEHLGSEKALLVLDNCEHLVEACADLADALLGPARI